MDLELLQRYQVARTDFEKRMASALVAQANEMGQERAIFHVSELSICDDNSSCACDVTIERGAAQITVTLRLDQTKAIGVLLGDMPVNHVSNLDSEARLLLDLLSIDRPAIN